ncbi:MAG: EAL domain-containing protein [Actinomycetota bacterium]|nr:EAL domain-containing protein [Actinomycetota bacterium]
MTRVQRATASARPGALLRSAPWALLVVIFVAELASGGQQFIGLLATPALLAAALLAPRDTAGVAVAATVSAVGAGVLAEDVNTTAQVVRTLAVAAAGVGGYMACRLRGIRVLELGQARELAEVADRLRLRGEQQAAVAELGVAALTGLSLGRLAQRATDLVAAVLRVELAKVLQLDPETAVLRLVAGTGWPPGLVGTASVTAAPDSQAGYTLATGVPVIVEDVTAESRFNASRLLGEHGVVSGISVSIPGPQTPFGVLSAHCRHRRSFSEDDVVFLQLVANVLGGAIQRVSVETSALHHALHDALTGLPNRTLLLDRLHQMYAARVRGRGEVVVLFIDLDDFKPVNDTLGHEAGDELLVALADRLRDLVRDTDTVARLAGDEFVVALQETDAVTAAEGLTRRIAEALSKPFRLRDGEAVVSASIGMALGSMASDPEALLANADAAMYQAKQTGAGQHAVYDEKLHSRHLRRLHVRQALRGAAERGELRLVYQPLVELRTGQMSGAEALLRWRHEELGEVSPVEFIPAAEETGVVLELGRWALGQACADAAGWQARFPERQFVVHINLSRRQLGDRNLIDVVQDALATSGVDPGRIGLEITESAVLEDTELALDHLRELKGLGLHLAMDDFGTGYSSLAQLTRLPVDAVKIDRELVRDLHSDPADRAVVAAVVRMAAALGLAVTAEGVELPDQLTTLRRLDCTFAQGFFLARPAPAASIDLLLGSDNAPVTLMTAEESRDVLDLTAVPEVRTLPGAMTTAPGATAASGGTSAPGRTSASAARTDAPSAGSAVPTSSGRV